MAGHHSTRQPTMGVRLQLWFSLRKVSVGHSGHPPKNFTNCLVVAKYVHTIPSRHASIPRMPSHILCHLHGCAVMHAGAFVNARNHRKWTPLHMAAEEGEEELITLLLFKKADANIHDLDGYTPLDLAAKNKHEGAAKILLKHPPSSAKDNALQTTLEHVMSSSDHHDIKDGVIKETISEMSPFGYALGLLYCINNIN